MKLQVICVFMPLLLSACSTAVKADSAESLAEYLPSEHSSTSSQPDFEHALLEARRYSEHVSTSYEEQYHLLTSYWRTLSTCLNEAGWSGHEIQKADSPNVVFLTPDVSGQEEAYLSDFTRCQNETDGFPQEPAANRETAENVYLSQVTFRYCAQTQGYSLSEPPSLESYTDAFLAGKVNWDPQGELLNTQQVPGSKLADLHSVCPYWY